MIMAWGLHFTWDILEPMHYNMGERQKLKKYAPYRKIAVVILIAAAIAVAYLVYSHQSANYAKPPVTKQQPQ